MEGISQVEGKRKRTRSPRRAARRAVHPHAHSHPFESRRKAVQLCLEESFPVGRVAREMGDLGKSGDGRGRPVPGPSVVTPSWDHY
jgi:hypothetical protein